MLDMQAMKQMMAEEGPIVEVVVLKEDGSVEQQTMDMSPKDNNVSKTLKGPATFIGQFHKIDVMIMKNREPSETMQENQHTLPRPFHKETVKGVILLIRMSEDSVPQSFTKSEYEAYVQQILDDPPPSEDEAEGEQEDAEQEDAEDDEDDELDADQEKVFQMMVDSFTEMHGRAPTEDELRRLLVAFNEQVAAEEGSDEESDAEEGDEEEEEDDSAEEEDDSVEEEEDGNKKDVEGSKSDDAKTDKQGDNEEESVKNGNNEGVEDENNKSVTNDENVDNENNPTTSDKSSKPQQHAAIDENRADNNAGATKKRKIA